MSDKWLNLEGAIPFIDAVSWLGVYRKIWAGKRYALILVKRVPAAAPPVASREVEGGGGR